MSVSFERPALLERLLAGAREGGPVLLAGPPGAGKTTLLHALGARLARDGCEVVSLDLMGAASTPERFVNAALQAMPAERFAGRLAEALEIRRLAGAGRAHGAAAVRALFELWASLDEAGGQPVVLVLDEVTEIRSLAYFAGLREVAGPFRAALVARRRGTILATSFPTLAQRLFDIEPLALPPLDTAELTAHLADAAAAREVVRASCGWPRYARILIEALRSTRGVARAWALEMAPGARLETAARATYESLLLRSRGYGVSKALLASIAQDEGRNLTAIYRQIGRSPGATRDYLGWLLGVDAVRMVGKRYFYVDGVLRHWVRLYTRGRLPTPAEIEAAAREAVGTELPAEAADPAARTRASEALMEID